MTRSATGVRRSRDFRDGAPPPPYAEHARFVPLFTAAEAPGAPTVRPFYVHHFGHFGHFGHFSQGFH